MTFPPVPVHPVGACPVCDARRPCPLCASRPGEEHAAGCPSWKEKALMMEEHSSAGLLVPDTIEKAQLDLIALSARLSALEQVAEAAVPLARLPFPVSGDERDEWRVHQQRLRDALAAAGLGADTQENE